MKIEATGDNDSSPFNCLPDEIVVEILRKLIDLKTLCICYVVCKRFSLIIVQVDTISLTTHPFVLDCNDDGVPTINVDAACFKHVLFWSAVKSMNKFIRLKSFCINLSCHTQEKEKEKENDRGVGDNPYLFKWKVKLCNNRVGSFLFLSPNSIYSRNTNNCNGNVQVDDDVQEFNFELMKKKHYIASKCLWDATERFNIISYGFPIAFPQLEKVSLTDSTKMGTVSLNGAEIVEMRKWLRSHSETFEQKLNHGIPNLSRVSFCYIPLLELPVSRYVMKGVYLFLMERDDLPNGHDSFLDIVEDVDVLEDNEEEAAYNEALMEILKKHRGKIATV